MFKATCIRRCTTQSFASTTSPASYSVSFWFGMRFPPYRNGIRAALTRPLSRTRAAATNTSWSVLNTLMGSTSSRFSSDCDSSKLSHSRVRRLTSDCRMMTLRLRLSESISQRDQSILFSQLGNRTSRSETTRSKRRAKYQSRSK